MTHPLFSNNILGNYTFTVPPYNPQTYLEEFKKKTRKLPTTCAYNMQLNSKNFAHPTHLPVAGHTYSIKMFELLTKAQGEDCLARLKAEPGSVLVGVLGLILLYDHCPEVFPLGKIVLTVDEPCTHGISNVLSIRRGLHGKKQWFSLGSLSDLKSSGTLLMSYGKV